MSCLPTTRIYSAVSDRLTQVNNFSVWTSAAGLVGSLWLMSFRWCDPWETAYINLKRKWQFQSCSSSNDQQREEKHINTTQPHAGLHTDGSVRPVWLSWGLRAAFRNEQCLSEVPMMMCTIYPSFIDHTAKHCSMVTGCALGQVSWELGSWFRRDRAVLGPPTSQGKCKYVSQ